MNKRWWFILAVVLFLPFYILFAGISFLLLQHNFPDASIQHFISLPGLKTAFLFTNLIAFITFFCLYFHIKPVTETVLFLSNLFRSKKPKSELFKLTHMNNKYLIPMKPGLAHYLKTSSSPPQKTNTSTKEELSFSDIIQQIIDQTRHIYPQLSLKTEILSDIKVPLFSQDLFQSLWEIIKNAHEATFQEKNPNSVTIRCFKKNDWFCCEIKDTGPGMNSETIAKANQLYFSTKKDASGVGLNLVESVLSRLGGLMQIDSPKGEGLCVTLFIPLDYLNYIQNLKDSSYSTSTSLLKEQEV